MWKYKQFILFMVFNSKKGALWPHSRPQKCTFPCNRHRQSHPYWNIKQITSSPWRGIHRDDVCQAERTLSHTLYSIMIYDMYEHNRRSDQFLLKLQCPPQSHPQVEHNGHHGNRRISVLSLAKTFRGAHGSHRGMVVVINWFWGLWLQMPKKLRGLRVQDSIWRRFRFVLIFIWRNRFIGSG